MEDNAFSWKSSKTLWTDTGLRLIHPVGRLIYVLLFGMFMQSSTRLNTHLCLAGDNV